MTPPPAETGPRSGPAALEAAVLRIRDRADQTVGMGFLITPDTALTCAHVVSAALGTPAHEEPSPDAGVRVDLPLAAEPGPSVTARVERWVAPRSSDGGDVAVLRLPAPLPAARPVRLVGAAAADTWGHHVRAFGLPRGRPGGVWHAGVLRGPQADGWVQADLEGVGYPVSRGFSGSPVWDEQLAGVVGMVVVAEARKPSASYLIPTGRLADTWPALHGLLRPARPFRGLSAFRESDAQIFHGRHRESTELARMVADHRWVTLVGPSGSGKSSLAMAGVAPRLRAAGTQPVVVRPAAGSSPLSALASALLPLLEPTSSETSRLTRVSGLTDELTAAGGLGRIAERLPRPTADGPALLVVVDQLEELLAAEPAAAAEFAAVLFTDTLPASVRVLATLRADFLDTALADPLLGPCIGRQVYVLAPMGPERLREVITAPVAAIPGVEYEDRLTEVILADVSRAPGALPLLGLTLDLLWQHRRDGVLTHAAYEDTGGVAGALARHAERVWAEHVSPQDEETARRLLTRLVRVPPGQAPATRRMVPRTELGEAEWQIAGKLAAGRLVVTGRSAEDVESVELAHDALITAWPRLATWVADDRRFLAWRESLRLDRERWERGGRPVDLLPNRTALTAARIWLRERGAELGEAERDFLDRGRAHRGAQARRRHSLRAGLALAVALTLVLGTLLYAQHRQAQQHTALANSRALAQASADQLDSDPALSSMLAIAAYRASPTPEARDQLLQQYLRQIPAGRTVSGFLGPLGDFSADRDGEVLLVRSLTRATLYVHAATGHLRMLRLPPATPVSYPVVSADGTRAATVNEDGSVDWYRVTPNARRIVQGVHHLAPGRGLPRPDYAGGNAAMLPDTHGSNAALSPDGRILAYATSTRVVVRNLDTGRGSTMAVPHGHNGDVWFGPDERTLLADVRAGDGRSRIIALDLVTGRTRAITPAADQTLVSADGSAVVVCRKSGADDVLHADGTVQVFRTRDGKQQGRTYPDRGNSCRLQAADASGHRLLLGPPASDTASSLRVIDADRGTLLSTFHATGKAAQLVTAHGKALLLTADTNRIGFVPVPRAPGTLRVDKAALTDDGSKVISVLSHSCLIQLRPAKSGSKLLAQVRRPEPCRPLGKDDQLTLDPTGRLFALRDGDHTVSVHQVSTLKRLSRVTTPAPPGTSLQYFFDDGGHLVTRSGTLVQQWDTHTGRQLARFDTKVFRPKTVDGILDLFVGRYPAPGTVDVIAWGDPVVHLVNLTTGHVTNGPRLTSDTHAVMFDPTGRHLAVLHSGGTIELWNRDPLRREVDTLPSVENEDGLYVAQFIDGQGHFMIAAQDSVRIYRVGHSAYEDAYEFGNPTGIPNAMSYRFLDASKNGRTVLYANTADVTGGPVDLDPAVWRKALCQAIGYREFTSDDRRNLPAPVPTRPVC
ncbi:trypsin-like peptidase domain-containing protein [Streptomyces sediminimaris]|uniref:nSTAND1 domain-containing NTPase n=1 Tax=Streptomyces sediminimaris TaxID=3383721 RepID=UPI00399BFA87